MKALDPPPPCARPRPGSRPWRRIRVLVRLAIRALLRAELVETDASGNPKINPIRWL